MHSSIGSFAAAHSRRAILILVAALLPAAARAQIAVLSSLVEERVAAPGTRYGGTLVISNASSRPETVRLFQADYRFAADGTSTFDPPSSSPRSNTPWIVLQRARVVVPAEGRVTLPYTVDVPASDSLRGTYWSAVMVEGVSDGAAAGHESAGGVSVGAVMRYAVQVATHIQTTGTRTVRFADAGITTSADGRAVLDVDVQHTGERAMRPVIWVEVYDAEGAVRARARQERGLLYPGTSLRQHFDLGRLATGRYKAVVFADTGDDAVVAMQFTIIL